MLFDPDRHTTLNSIAWDENVVRQTITHIVQRTESEFVPASHWPKHPMDMNGVGDNLEPMTPLYMGSCGVIWALHYLQDAGAVRLERSYRNLLDEALLRNRAWLASEEMETSGAYLMGDVPFLMMALGADPVDTAHNIGLVDQLEGLIIGNLDNPTRELMWGSPGTLLAALFLHQRCGGTRWAELFRTTARKLWTQLLWSPEQQCYYWSQDMYGAHTSYLDGVHGFVATAVPLIAGRGLLTGEEWAAWEQCITNTITRSVTREDDKVNWRVMLLETEGSKRRYLMQFCHGAPGFVICLGSMPGTALDELLLAAGETVWAAGPLTKGSNLCHGTGGNGYTFLKLYERTQDATWLHRARAFAMHGIGQVNESAAQYGQLRHSLWTGDIGFAIYLWDCLRGQSAFPTLDVFYADLSDLPK